MPSRRILSVVHRNPDNRIADARYEPVFADVTAIGGTGGAQVTLVGS